MRSKSMRIAPVLGAALIAIGLVAAVATAAKPKVSIGVSNLVSFASTQTNNNGVSENAEQTEFALCPKGKPVGPGMDWSFFQPADVNSTPTSIHELSRFGSQQVGGQGSSDTDASQARFRVELACLAGKAKKELKYRSQSVEFASNQADNNGAAISSGPIVAQCKPKERAIGWFADSTFTAAPASDEIYQLDTIRIKRRSVVGIVDSDTDTNADLFEAEITAVCLKKPDDLGLKVKIRTESDGVTHTIKQANNDGGVIQVPGDRSRCRKPERLIAGGGYWRFTEPDDPAETLAQLQDINLSKRAVRVAGGSDVNAVRSTLIIQAVCLGPAN
jgi:predicted outer membrane repeat protein